MYAKDLVFLWDIFEEGAKPKPITEAPILDEDLEWANEAFWLLSSSRVYTAIGPAPIPLSEVLAYIQLYPVADVDEFVRMIRGMDEEYLAYLAEKRDNT